MREPEPSGRAATQLAPGEPLPLSLRIAVWLLAAEAVALSAVVVLLVIADLNAPSANVRGGVLVTVYAAVLAAVLAGSSVALRRRRAWARGPAIVLQLLLVPVGYTMVTGGLPLLGLPVVLAGLVGAGALIAPTTRAALGGR